MKVIREGMDDVIDCLQSVAAEGDFCVQRFSPQNLFADYGVWEILRSCCNFTPRNVQFCSNTCRKYGYQQNAWLMLYVLISQLIGGFKITSKRMGCMGCPDRDSMLDCRRQRPSGWTGEMFSSDAQLPLMAPRPFLSHTLMTTSANGQNLVRGWYVSN